MTPGRITAQSTYPMPRRSSRPGPLNAYPALCVKDANGQSLAYVYARETGANRYELAHFARLGTCAKGLETRRVTFRYR